LGLSCNAKMFKTTAKLSENNRNKRRFNRFQCCTLWRQTVWFLSHNLSYLWCCMDSWMTY
jgi:hypothetical protein